MLEVHEIQEKLLKLKECLKDTKKLIILMHDHPDPDGLSSSLALATIVKELFQIPSVVRYTGIISRAENRQMIRLLKIPAKRFSPNEIEAKVDIALVDSQPHTGNSAIPKGVKPLVVIDHHPLRKTTKAEFIDIRSDYGATATILGEYLLGSGLTVTSQLATALCYGISSETERLGREVGPTDTEIYVKLFQLASKKILSKIENPKLPRNYYLTLSRALSGALVYKNAIVSNLGLLTQPDFVPIVAELLLKCERMTWSLCMGRFEDKILISVRTTNQRAQAGKLLRAVLDKKGSAGGHGMIAGGQVACAATEEECHATEEAIIQTFLRKIGYKEIGELTPLLMEAPAPVTPS